MIVDFFYWPNGGKEIFFSESTKFPSKFFWLSRVPYGILMTDGIYVRNWKITTFIENHTHCLPYNLVFWFSSDVQPVVHVLVEDSAAPASSGGTPGWGVIRNAAKMLVSLTTYSRGVISQPVIFNTSFKSTTCFSLRLWAVVNSCREMLG